MPAPDREEVLRALAVLVEPDDVIELRAIHKGARRRIDSGYFDGQHRDQMADSAVELSGAGAAVYVTLNPVKPELLSRYQNRVEQRARCTTTDAEIQRRRWLLVDLDPVRPTDTSATAEQLAAAQVVAQAIYKALKDRGWPSPVVAMSGNGYHLLYRVDLPADSESAVLLKSVLAGLGAEFDTDAVKVDRGVHNAARVTKLYGTVSTKGDHTSDTPWRVSAIEYVPAPLAIVAVHQLRLVAGATQLSPAPESRPSATPAGAQATARDGERAPPRLRSVSAETVDHLRSALKVIDAEKRETWIAIGHALRELGEVGWELWDEYSRRGSTYGKKDDPRTTWEGFHPDHTCYEAVFAAAQRAGWVNPASRSAAQPREPWQVRAARAMQTTVGAEKTALAVIGTAMRLADKTMAQAARDARSLTGDDGFSFVRVAPNEPIESRTWFWDGLLPGGEVTLLPAHGETGKSFISLMLAVSIALGRPLFGRQTRQARVAFYSAEDSRLSLRERQTLIEKCLGVSFDSDDLAGLHILDATIADPELYAETRVKKGPTVTYTRLLDYVERHEIDVLIVDNASDTFGASEIDRGSVRAFIRQLRQLVSKRGGSVLLLSHTNKQTARGARDGEEYSGSTAWHNSVRSRLFLERTNYVEETGYKELRLTNQKMSVTGLRARPIELEWYVDQLPQLRQPLSPAVAGILCRNDLKAVLRLIHEFTERGEFVSTAESGPGTVARRLGGEPTCPKLTSREWSQLLRGANRDGYTVRETYKTAQRKDRERWALTDKGREQIGAGA